MPSAPSSVARRTRAQVVSVMRSSAALIFSVPPWSMCSCQCLPDTLSAMVRGLKQVKMTGTSSPALSRCSSSSSRERSSRARAPLVTSQTWILSQSSTVWTGVLTSLATPPLLISE